MERVGGDTIQFESRQELGEIIRMIEEYKDKHKEVPHSIERLYNILDVMEMEW